MKIKPLLLTSFCINALFAMGIASANSATTPIPSLHPKVAVSSAAPAPALTPAQIKQIEQVVHDYLLKNPKILLEASQVYQDQELAKAKSKTQQAITKNIKTLFNAPNSPAVGDLNGDVTVVEFLDYQCAHCREMSTIVENLIKGDDKVRVVIKEIPIFGGASKFASQASIAAIKQGQDKFLAFYKGLLQVALPLTNEKILDVAKKANLNVTQLQADMKNKAIEGQMNANFKLAQELGLLGTPAFIIGNRAGTHNEYIPGTVTLETLKQNINKVRQ